MHGLRVCILGRVLLRCNGALLIPALLKAWVWPWANRCEVEAQAGPAPASSPAEIHRNKQELGAHGPGGAVGAMLIPGTWAAGQTPAVRSPCDSLPGAVYQGPASGWSPPALGAGLGQQRLGGSAAPEARLGRKTRQHNWQLYSGTTVPRIRQRWPRAQLD